MKPYIRKFTESEDFRANEIANVNSKHNLDIILEHYLIAALWSSTDESDAPLDDNYSTEDFSVEAKEKSGADIKEFINEAEPFIGDEASDEQIGHDFWLTRNGHGAGFWDRDGLYTDGDKLSEIAEKFGEVNAMIGDDGKVEIE